MTDQEHTPTPLSLPLAVIVFQPGTHGSGIQQADNRLVATGLTEEQAKQLVRCVNSNAGLVEACKAALRIVPRCRVADQITAAIAAAEVQA